MGAKPVTDFRKNPEYRPWAKQLDRGDKLTPQQARAVCETRLEEFGQRLVETKHGWFVVVDED